MFDKKILYDFLDRVHSPIILFDLDGTIVFNNDVSPSILKRIHLLKEKGLIVGIATGRTYLESRKILRKVSPNGFSILNDGKMIYDFNSHKAIILTSFYEKEYFDIKRKFQIGQGCVEEYLNGYKFGTNKLKSLFRYTLSLERNNLPEPKEGDPLINVYIASEYLRSNLDLKENLVNNKDNKKIIIEKYGPFWYKMIVKKTDKSDVFEKSDVFFLLR